MFYSHSSNLKGYMCACAMMIVAVCTDQDSYDTLTRVLLLSTHTLALGVLVFWLLDWSKTSNDPGLQSCVSERVAGLELIIGGLL